VSEALLDSLILDRVHLLCALRGDAALWPCPGLTDVGLLLAAWLGVADGLRHELLAAETAESCASMLDMSSGLMAALAGAERPAPREPVWKLRGLRAGDRLASRVKLSLLSSSPLAVCRPLAARSVG